MNLRMLLILATFSSAILATSKGVAQDYFSLFGTGVETKSTAGAGLTASRGAAAAFYNPANLMLSPKGMVYDSVLDIISLQYSYEYPGEKPSTVKQTVPIPFFGATFRSPEFSKLAIGGSFLPIPGGASEQKIKDVWLRLPDPDGLEEPSHLNITTKNQKKWGYRGSLGVAYRVWSGLNFGLSLEFSKFASQLQADNADPSDQSTIMKSESTVRREALILGMRASAFRGRLQGVFTLNPGSINHSDIRTELPTASALLKSKPVTRGPLIVGAGLEAKIGLGIVPFLEAQYEQWQALRTQKRISAASSENADYFDTLDLKAGASWQNGPHTLRGGLGFYQSHLGQGIMKKYSADNIALNGQEFGDIDGIPYVAYAAGYSFAIDRYVLKSAVAMVSGARDVWEKATGYGHYALQISSITLGLTVTQ